MPRFYVYCTDEELDEIREFAGLRNRTVSNLALSAIASEMDKARSRRKQTELENRVESLEDALQEIRAQITTGPRPTSRSDDGTRVVGEI